MIEIKNEEELSATNPKHYQRDGAMECWDEMELLFGTEAVMHFAMCNAWKYRYRAADKNGTEDIAKSDVYMRKYKELSEKSMNKWKSMISNIPVEIMKCQNEN